jgi:hypothetical protein
MGTFAAIRRYGLNWGLLLIPAIVWNVALAGRLPPFFASEAWLNIPRPLALIESSSRLAVFSLPFLMPLKLERSSKTGLLTYAAGMLVYFASWLPLILAPSSAWSSSALGLAAPAYTPSLWLLGIALAGRQLFWGSFYRWWMYALLSIAFLAAHTSHALLAFQRSHP